MTANVERQRHEALDQLFEFTVPKPLLLNAC